MVWEEGKGMMGKVGKDGERVGGSLWNDGKPASHEGSKVVDGNSHLVGGREWREDSVVDR